MEKGRVFVSGGLKLPIGYRFHPTDEELVVHYLKRKVFGMPLPALVIPEFDVFHVDPWSLPGDLKENRFFFTQKMVNEDENKLKRAAGCGYWKPIGKGRQIAASCSNQIVGIRRTLVFREAAHSNHTNTQWVMHEYRLVGSPTIQISRMKMADWNVYRVFQRKRKTKKHGVFSKLSKTNKTKPEVEVTSFGSMDLRMELEGSDADPPQPSSPCSSGITEVSTNGLDQEAEIGSLFTFSTGSSTSKN